MKSTNLRSNSINKFKTQILTLIYHFNKKWLDLIKNLIENLSKNVFLLKSSLNWNPNWS